MKMNNVHIAITHYISEPFSESFIKKEVPEKNTHDTLFNFFVISYDCGKPDFTDYQQSFFIYHTS